MKCGNGRSLNSEETSRSVFAVIKTKIHLPTAKERPTKYLGALNPKT